MEAAQAWDTVIVACVRASTECVGTQTEGAPCLRREVVGSLETISGADVGCNTMRTYEISPAYSVCATDTFQPKTAAVAQTWGTSVVARASAQTNLIG